MSNYIKPFLFALIVFFVNAINVSWAQEEDLTPAQQEVRNALIAAIEAMQAGPASIPLSDQATLELPEGFGFLPKTQAARFMRAIGNTVDNGFFGLIIPNEKDSEWWIIDVTYNPEGYIKDDDAQDWDADDLLTSLKEGTETANSGRAARGLPQFEVAGWIEKPTYDEVNHRLVWSVAVRGKDQAKYEEEGVNYNTLMLGREGFISMNLITGRNRVDALKPVAKTLLANLHFNEGKRYADFNASTDKVAEYGLAALVAGVAAKKLGFFAVIAAFVAKFAKAIIVAAAVGIGALSKRFGKKKAS